MFSDESSIGNFRQEKQHFGIMWWLCVLNFSLFVALLSFIKEQ